MDTAGRICKIVKIYRYKKGKKPRPYKCLYYGFMGSAFDTEFPENLRLMLPAGIKITDVAQDGGSTWNFPSGITIPKRQSKETEKYMGRRFTVPKISFDSRYAPIMSNWNIRSTTQLAIMQSALEEFFYGTDND